MLGPCYVGISIDIPCSSSIQGVGSAWCPSTSQTFIFHRAISLVSLGESVIVDSDSPSFSMVQRQLGFLFLLEVVMQLAITWWLSMSWIEIGPFRLHPKNILVANGSPIEPFLISKVIKSSVQSCPISMLTSPSDFISARSKLHKCEYVSTWKDTFLT